MEHLLPYLLPILAAVIVWIVAKIFKVTIDEQKVRAILDILIEIIFGVEEKYTDLPGAEKNIIATREAEERLTESQKSKLSKVYGSVSKAVQTAFRVAQPIIEIRKLIKK